MEELEKFASERVVQNEADDEYIEIFIDHNYKRFNRVIDCLRDNELPRYFTNE